MEIKEKVIKRVSKLEEMFSKNNYDGIEGFEFDIKKGNIPVMISAPHTVKHKRNNKMKQSEVFTGAIALFIQEVTNCHLIYSKNMRNSDPNYSEEKDSIYKKELKQYIKENNIKFLIDFHGCKEERNFALDLGTINKNAKSLKTNKYIKDMFKYIMEIYLNKYEKNKVLMNKEFNAKRKNTITYYINNKCNISTIQVEVNNVLRNLYKKENEDGVYDFIKGFTYIVSTLGDAI